MKNVRLLSALLALTLLFTLTFALTCTAFAADDAEAPAAAVQVVDPETRVISVKAIAAAAIVGVAAVAGAIAMAMAICKSNESMARQPEAAGKINSAMMLGLVFIETLIIYALIVAILIIFVL